jgi:hypothetical protein
MILSLLLVYGVVFKCLSIECLLGLILTGWIDCAVINEIVNIFNEGKK